MAKWQPKRPSAGRLVALFRLLLLGGLAALLLLAMLTVDRYTDWLWFESLGYTGVYVTALVAQVGVFLVAALAFFGLLAGNVAAGAFFAVVLGLTAARNWLVLLTFVNARPFGTVDPLFGQDVSFYVFALPFARFVHGWLVSALLLAA